MSGRYDDSSYPEDPAPWHDPVLIVKPDWFDELVTDSRLAAREHWFLPDGRHRAYVNAADPPRVEPRNREDAA